MSKSAQWINEMMAEWRAGQLSTAEIATILMGITRIIKENLAIAEAAVIEVQTKSQSRHIMVPNDQSIIN